MIFQTPGPQRLGVFLMKTIIAGSRSIGDLATVLRAVNEAGWTITEVVCGGARGVDTLGELWAHRAGVPVRRFPADWDKHGKAAGPIRNGEMADYAEALIAIWDGVSPGTWNMIQQGRRRGLKVFVYRA